MSFLKLLARRLSKPVLITMTSPASSALAKAGITKAPKDVTEEEWKKILDPEVYQVTRQAGTEAPFSGQFDKFLKDGKFHCLCCGAELFSSNSKFDSGCGWAAFWKAERAEGKDESASNVIRIPDLSHGVERVELRCKQCNAHLGHVFEDGPKPTGERFCINSCTLNFEPKPKQ